LIFIALLANNNGSQKESRLTM